MKPGLGAVYLVLRERDEAYHRSALAAMAETGIDTIVVWPPISRWEDPSLEGSPYRTGRFLLDEAQKRGLKVVFELAGQIPLGEAVPDAVMKDEYYTQGPGGVPDNRLPYYGSLNHFHPEVEALTETYLRDTVRAYRGHPALAGWDLWNETMFVSEDPWTLSRFQTWLEDRYGSLKALNDAWDRSFTAWNQVRFSTWMWASVMPQVDWWTFRKHAVGLVLGRWNRIVKEEDPATPTIADNIHSMLTERWADDRPQDDWIVASCVDRFGISFYPKSGVEAADPVWRSLTFAAARSAGRGRFWVSELQTHRKGLLTPESSVAPEELVRWTTEAWAHGAENVVYWMWEPFSRGWQVGGRGLVDRQGRATPRSKAVEALAKAPRAEVPGVAARAAVFVDSRNFDFFRAVSQLNPAASGTLTRSYLGAWRTLAAAGILSAVVVPGDLKAGLQPGLSLVLVSWQLLVTDDRQDEWKDWVEAGGTLVIDGAFGVLDDQGRSPAVQPGAGRNSWWGWQTGEVPQGDGFNLEPGPDAEVLGRSADGTASTLRVRRGAGKVWAFGNSVWAQAADREDTNAAAVLEEILHDLRF